jgi:outer membrane receptor protein involved in Fe transport
MSRRLVAPWPLMLAFSALVAASSAFGQQMLSTSRGPRFVLAAVSPGRQSDASREPVLRRRVSLDLRNVTVGEALKQLTRQAALEISYSPWMVPLDSTVSLHAEGITVAAALTEILLDLAVDVSVTSGGALALVRRARPATSTLSFDSSAVSGQVRDSTSGSPIAGATVSIEGGRHSSITNEGGRYRIGGLSAGTYTVRARFIGYTSLAVIVRVMAAEEHTIDFPLVKSAQPLEQVVVTGTVVPTAVKALPTPVSVIDEADIAGQRPHTMQELFRQAVPTAISWDHALAPYTTAFSARGASTLGAGSGQMKVFVDGVEVANPSNAPVDPNSIERVEVVRGPQAAAIYGSDAIGGVVQIFTKRGDPSLIRPQLSLGGAAGVVQTPYAGYDGVLRQDYTASVRGSGADASYNFGAGYSRTADYLPNGEQSAQSSPSVYGGVRVARGIITADVSGRHFTHSVPNVFNPELFRTGFFFWSAPFFQPTQVRNEMVAARLTVRATSWWQHTLTVGVDRATQDLRQSRPRRTTPGDTLLQVFSQASSKTSIGYSTSLLREFGSTFSGSLTVGFDHYSLPVSQYSTSGALNTDGAIKTAPDQSVSASQTVTNNTGYFTQAQLGIHDALFITAGIRAEQNTGFGDSLGTPVSPRAGLSYARQLGSVSVKLRSSYGRAIRAPAPGRKLESISATGITLANAQLGPERQMGWDVGVDAVLGTGGTVSLTYYDQVAQGLIQLVRLDSDSIPTFQNQNVGRVGNTGVEIEASLALGRIKVRGQYGYARSRIEQLPPNYGGDLRVGDQSQYTPKHTAGASIAASLGQGTAVTAGLTYVGGWTGFDWIAYYKCFGQTGSCQPGPGTRNYLISYPGFAKLSAGVTQRLSRTLSGFVLLDNASNNEAYEFWNANPVMGRTATVGLQFQY